MLLPLRIPKPMLKLLMLLWLLLLHKAKVPRILLLRKLHLMLQLACKLEVVSGRAWKNYCSKLLSFLQLHEGFEFDFLFYYIACCKNTMEKSP